MSEEGLLVNDSIGIEIEVAEILLVALSQAKSKRGGFRAASTDGLQDR